MDTPTYNQVTGEITLSWRIQSNPGFLTLHDHPHNPFVIYVSTLQNRELERIGTVELGRQTSFNNAVFTFIYNVDRDVNFGTMFFTIRQYVGEYTVHYEVINPHFGIPFSFSEIQTNLIVSNHRSVSVSWSPRNFVDGWGFDSGTGVLTVTTNEGTASWRRTRDASTFQITDVQTVVIADSVTRIENSAFMNCNRLRAVIFSEDSQLATIGTAAFLNCTNLTSITIPDSVTHFSHGHNPSAFRLSLQFRERLHIC
jgi:hypothetical protein